MKLQLDEKQQEWFINTLKNPADWCEAFLKNPTDPQKNMELRSYQRTPLEASRESKNMSLLWGRRSGKSVVLCSDALWWAVAKPLVTMYEQNGTKQVPTNILILTPMDSQIKMLFDTLLCLCADSPFIQDMITKVRRSDVNEIHFKNGSIIKGMTIGISTANKGTSVRGLSADYLLIDEMDYIPRDIMEQSILPIASTNRHCRMRICSTPTGKRELFYEYNTNKKLGWWVSKVPSWHPDNPSWISIKECEETGRPIHESTEYFYKSVMDSNAYLREFGAEFGEEVKGVYRNDLINKSLTKYCESYDATDPTVFDPKFEQTPGNKYIIGVDWNTYVNGGQVVVLEYCLEPTFITYYDHQNNTEISIDCTNKFRLFYRKGVKSTEGTQRATRDEIIRLVKHYKIDHIYVDYGHGDTNVEELTFYGKQYPELGLTKKLHTIDSGSNIEHYDPMLKKNVKKRAKSLMVNTTAVSLEEGRLVLPSEEDTKQRLISQMRGYTIKNVTMKGDFTYEGEDHILDAFNLAMWGFHHQYSTLLNTRLENKIKFMNNPMLKSAPERQLSIKNPILNNTKQIRDPEAPTSNVPRFSRRNNMNIRQNINRSNTFRRTF